MIATISGDAWVEKDLPAANHGQLAFLSVNGDATHTRYTYVFFQPPFPLDGEAVVSLALLHFFIYGAWTGSQNLTFERILEPWDENSVKWDNAPAVDATHAVVFNITGGASGDHKQVNIAPIMADVAAGAPFYGLRIKSSGTSNRAIVSAENGTETLRPYAELEWTVDSDEPIGLAPGGALAVSTNKPELSWMWGYADVQDDEVLQAYSYIQIDDDPAFPSPEYDSGWQPNTLTSWALADTAYAGVPEGATRYWRIKVRDSAGNETEWSDPAEFVYVPAGDLTLNYPPDDPDPVVNETTPDIDITLTDAAQESAELVLLQVDEQDPDESDDVEPADPDEDPEPDDVFDDDAEGIDGLEANPTEGDPVLEQPPPLELWRFPKSLTGDSVFTIPENLIDSAGVYQIAVRNWDAEPRDGISGDPGYLEVVRQFRYERPSSSIVPVTDLEVSKRGPMVELTWTYPEGEVLNYFSLRINGREYKQRIEVQDVRVGSSQTFTMKIWNLDPWKRHRIVIEAVKLVSGKHHHSKGNKRRYVTTKPIGAWLVDPSMDLAVKIRGLNPVDASWREIGTTYDIPGRPDPVRVMDSLGGFSGSVGNDAFVLGPKAADRFEKIKDRSQKRHMRLAWSRYNVPIRVEEGGLNPMSDTPPGTQQFAVEFGFYQVGEFPWKAHRK